MMATSFVMCGILSDRLEGEGDDFLTVVVGGERHHGQLDVLAELKLGGIILGQPALDANHVIELNKADAERNEILARRTLVRRTRGKALRCPGDECSSPGEQYFGHDRAAAFRAALLHR